MGQLGREWQSLLDYSINPALVGKEVDRILRLHFQEITHFSGRIDWLIREEIEGLGDDE